MLREFLILALLAPGIAFAQEPSLEVSPAKSEPPAVTATVPAASQPSPAPPSTAPRSFPIPSPLPPTAALPGDDQLDCGTLYAESKARIRQNSEINDKALAKTYTKGAETKALEVMGQIGGMVPILGGLISMGSAMGQMATTKADAERNYGESTRQSDWVMDRMVHVSDLYRDRCLKRSKK